MAARIRKGVTIYHHLRRHRAASHIFSEKTLKSNPCTGYKFNRHIYIPLNGQTVTNWEILLEFSDPVHDIEVWTVKPTQIDQDGLMWKFTSLDNQVGF